MGGSQSRLTRFLRVFFSFFFLQQKFKQLNINAEEQLFHSIDTNTSKMIINNRHVTHHSSSLFYISFFFKFSVSIVNNLKKRIKEKKKKIKNSVNGWDEKLNLEVFSRV